MTEESMFCYENGKPIPRKNKFDIDLYNETVGTKEDVVNLKAQIEKMKCCGNLHLGDLTGLYFCKENWQRVDEKYCENCKKNKELDVEISRNKHLVIARLMSRKSRWRNKKNEC